MQGSSWLKSTFSDTDRARTNYLANTMLGGSSFLRALKFRSFLHFDIRRNPFLVPLEANKSKNSDQLPENISYYPGAEVNIKMDRLLKAEQNILQEEERFCNFIILSNIHLILHSIEKIVNHKCIVFCYLKRGDVRIFLP